MRWSRLFIPTLRNVPSDAEAVSHQLLLRAGFVRQLGAGIYSHLPLARRSLLKIEAIVRQEMDAIGAQEFYLPALHPAELWMETGRWDEMAGILFRFKDRTDRDMCLGPTHEEVFTAIARDEIRSYRDLPQLWYQIQTKFRDEPRPKSGLLRVRQFTMKDSYSFDLEAAGLDESYQLHDQAYRRIFDRCGLKYVAVEAHSGAMGGSESQEFMVASPAGEDSVASCRACPYAANLERATSRVLSVEDDQTERKIERLHTPGQKTIQQVGSFLRIEPTRQIKSLVYIVDSKPYLILLRGDHQLSEAKLSTAVGSNVFRAAGSQEIVELLGAEPGSLGPVGVSGLTVLADHALGGRKNLVCGANEDDYHLGNVVPGRDFECAYTDLRSVEEGDPCPNCGQLLQVTKALEIGHIFKLGYKYSKSMGLSVLNQQGQEVPVIMGSYGIGVERIMAAAVELYHDELGIIWPRSIAPFQVLITVLSPKDENQMQFAEQLYQDLERLQIDCLLDDRDERPGVKFKDSELIGFPIRVTLGKKLAEGKVELFSRAERQMTEAPADSAIDQILQMLGDYRV